MVNVDRIVLRHTGSKVRNVFIVQVTVKHVHLHNVHNALLLIFFIMEYVSSIALNLLLLFNIILRYKTNVLCVLQTVQNVLIHLVYCVVQEHIPIMVNVLQNVHLNFSNYMACA